MAGCAKKYREKCAETAINKLARAEGNKLAKLAYSADKLLKRVTKAIEDPNQFNRYIVDGAEITDNGEVQKKIEVCFSKADTKAMLEMANTLKTLTAVIRTSMKFQRTPKWKRGRLRWKKCSWKESGEKMHKAIMKL